MSSLFQEKRTIHGLDVYIPTAGVAGSDVQGEWHAGRLMARLADEEPTSENLLKGRKRLVKVMKACKDVHMQMWPGAPIPLREALSSSHTDRRVTR